MPPGSTILLVEDSDAVRSVLTRHLEHEGYAVRAASGAEEAIRLIDYARTPIDLAIVDVVLPSPGSVAVMEAARAVMSPLRVLVISALDEGAVRRSSLVKALESEPHFRFMGKPFALATFSQMIEDLLASDDATIEVATGEWPIPK